MASKREERRRRKQREHAARRRGAESQRSIPRHAFGLEPPALERCAAPIHVDQALQRVEDPCQRLGLAPHAARDPDAVQAAWRRALEQHPPEREPETARLVTAARDRLLAPSRAIERQLGILLPPDPHAHGLSTELPRRRATRLGADRRLLCQLMLYTLLERELEGGRSAPPKGELPFG